MPSASAAAAGPDLASAMRDLVRYRQEHLTGDEKGEGQIFLEHLFLAFGHAGLRQAGAFLEARMRRRSGQRQRTSFADCTWKPRVLIEMKKAGEPLGRHYDQALEYSVDSTGRRNTSRVRSCDGNTQTASVGSGGSSTDAFTWSAAGGAA